MPGHPTCTTFFAASRLSLGGLDAQSNRGLGELTYRWPNARVVIDDIATAPPDATQVVKFHGTFDDDASLVLTESSYFDRLDFESAIDIKLRADMLGKCLLFIGYSLSDINMRYMLYKLHKMRRQLRRDAVRTPSAFLATFSAGEVQRTLLAQWDVSIIELDPINKDESMADFLETLI